MERAALAASPCAAKPTRSSASHSPVARVEAREVLEYDGGGGGRIGRRTHETQLRLPFFTQLTHIRIRKLSPHPHHTRWRPRSRTVTPTRSLGREWAARPPRGPPLVLPLSSSSPSDFMHTRFPFPVHIFHIPIAGIPARHTQARQLFLLGICSGEACVSVAHTNGAADSAPPACVREATPTPTPRPRPGKRELSGDDAACNQLAKGRVGPRPKAQIDDPRGGHIADYCPEFGGPTWAGVRSDASQGRRMVPTHACALKEPTLENTPDGSYPTLYSVPQAPGSSTKGFQVGRTGSYESSLVAVVVDALESGGLSALSRRAGLGANPVLVFPHRPEAPLRGSRARQRASPFTASRAHAPRAGRRPRIRVALLRTTSLFHVLLLSYSHSRSLSSAIAFRLFALQSIPSNDSLSSFSYCTTSVRLIRTATMVPNPTHDPTATLGFDDAAPEGDEQHGRAVRRPSSTLACFFRIRVRRQGQAWLGGATCRARTAVALDGWYFAEEGMAGVKGRQRCVQLETASSRPLGTPSGTARKMVAVRGGRGKDGVRDKKSLPPAWRGGARRVGGGVQQTEVSSAGGMLRKSLMAWEKVVRDGEQARRVLHMREVMGTAALSRAWISVDARRSTVGTMSCVCAGVEG
ncbi:hypothetical protein B0H14DRAFT_3886562 [Mycena olivaceomarginata]|nr:hypothetical protein B0H14DRAFT_3886562 [Mycena olivaceomarginata]